MNILVAYKKSTFQIYAKERRDPKLLRLLRERSVTVAKMRRSHDLHERTIEAVHEAIERLGCRAQFVYRANVRPIRGVDLVVTIGGDGTILEVARHLAGIPLLGVNSAPGTSLGLFCGADHRTVRDRLARHLAGDLAETPLARLSLEAAGHSVWVLNEVLYAHRNPAATSRYILRIGDREEEQRSSGLWVATAAGSTGGIFSAGGRMLPIRSRRTQYWVREPFIQGSERPRLLHGVLPAGFEMVLHSKMRQGMVYVDGAHHAFALGFGDRAHLTGGAPPLRVLGLDAARRRRLFGE